ncbi:MAG: sugar phosphate isomerase/epimerase family protein [Pirellulaceae bacterium]
MYKNLSPRALGITGRQSEIIELALTYGFHGMELDLADFSKRVEYRDLEYASRFVQSANINIGGFDLPVRWRGDEEIYKADLSKLDSLVVQAAHLGAKSCRTLVMPGSDDLPYHENFEQHRQRLSEMAEMLAKHGIRLGVGFLAAPMHREEQQYEFIRDAEALVTLIKSVAHDSVGLMLDTWNWHFGGSTMDLLTGLEVSLIESVHLADASAESDAAVITDEHRVLPGQDGAVKNIDILTHFNKNGYEGPVTLAPHPKCFSGMTRDNIVQRCSSVFDQLWRAVGVGRVAEPAAAVARGG